MGSGISYRGKKKKKKKGPWSLGERKKGKENVPEGKSMDVLREGEQAPWVLCPKGFSGWRF